jgi:outer membrane protein insertion porin family
MKSVLVMLVTFAAAVLPLRAMETRDLVLSGIPVQLRGVSPEMAAPARLVLENQLALSGDTAASSPLADDLAFFLQQRYFHSGFPKATLDWTLPGATVVLEVKEGPRRTVGKVEFEGVDPGTAAMLTPFLTRQTREREGRGGRSLPFVEADLEGGLGLVLRKLQSEGFLSATAAAPRFTEPPGDGPVDIKVRLTPGPLSVFGKIVLSGDPAPLSNAARDKISALTGQPFSEVRLENVRKEIKGDLQAQGRFAAEVSTTASDPGPVGGEIAASLFIAPGEVFKVSGVRSDPSLSRGARRVADSVFGSATGQPYAPGALDLLHRRSMVTGIFSRLEVDPVATGSDTLELSINGEEAKPKTLGFFAGYETFYGPIAGIEARHVNFMDSGNAVGLRAEWRGTGANGSLEFSDPAILGSRNSFGMSLGVETFTFKDYSRNTLSFRNSLTRRFDRHITAELFSGLTVNEMDSDVLTPEELGPDSYGTVTGGGRLTLDFRDNPLNPRSGWLAGGAVEGGFDQGGDDEISFVRTDLNGAWYQPLGGPWRLALGARASALRSSGELADLPIDLRLFNGGGTTVRSFAEREMGATSARGSTPLGGTAVTVLNAELSYEIISNLELAAFVDAGSVSREDSSLFGVDDLRYGVGLGLRYQLPIGPLRVDYGYNPDRRPGEAAGALHLTFGFAF